MFTHSLLPYQWDGEENQKKNMKLVGWDEDSLTEQQRKRKITTILIKRIYKALDTQCNFSNSQMPSPLSSSDPPFPASSPSYILSMMSYGMEYQVCLDSLGQPSRLCPLPASCETSPYPT